MEVVVPLDDNRGGAVGVVFECFLGAGAFVAVDDGDGAAWGLRTAGEVLERLVLASGGLGMPAVQVARGDLAGGAQQLGVAWARSG
ncbi:hypothetical protein GCM10009753_77770 [Streptantibioticus ferralitis]